MNSCEYVTYITALACSIAKNRSAEELALLGSVFNQLGDTLSTISAREDLCSSEKEPDSSNESHD